MKRERWGARTEATLETRRVQRASHARIEARSPAPEPTSSPQRRFALLRFPRRFAKTTGCMGGTLRSHCRVARPTPYEPLSTQARSLFVHMFSWPLPAAVLLAATSLSCDSCRAALDCSSNCCCCGLHCSVRRKPTPSLGKGHESKPNCRRTKALLRFSTSFFTTRPLALART